MIDAARFPREKLCGGAITGGGLRELEIAGLALRVPHAVVAQAVARWRGTSVRVDLPHPAVVVRRAAFDADLVAQARAAGAEVLEETALEGIQGRVAATRQGPIAFGALVAADGVGGASRRALGLPAGTRVPLREGAVSGDLQWSLLFDLEPGVPGYAWRFPCIDQGSPSERCGVYAAAPGAPVGRAFDGFVRREHLEADAPGSSAIRLFEPGGPFGRGSALLAGEALGVDGLLGEGIRYALWSGRVAGELAARAVLRGAVPSQEAYRARLLATRSGVQLRLGAHLARRLYGPDPRWRRFAVDGRVAAALAALVSGAAPVAPLLAMAARLPSLVYAELGGGWPRPSLARRRRGA